MSQIYKDGSFFSGGGNSSNVEILQKIEDLTAEMEKLNQRQAQLNVELQNLITTVGGKVSTTAITRSKTVTEAGKAVVDATELNPQVTGSIANRLGTVNQKDDWMNMTSQSNYNRSFSVSIPNDGFTLFTNWNAEPIEGTRLQFNKDYVQLLNLDSNGEISYWGNVWAKKRNPPLINLQISVPILGGGIIVYAIGNLVTMAVSFQIKNDLPGGTQIAVLPEEFRPPTELHDFFPDGRLIRIYNSGVIAFDGAYAAGAWLDALVTFGTQTTHIH